MNFPDEKVWIPKLLLKNFIYNSIRDHGLPFVLDCLEDSITHLAMGIEEWEKEFDIKEILIAEPREKSKVEYTGRITISQLASKKYGMKIVEGRSLCPFHDGKNKTSFMFDDLNNSFICWSCREHGNLIHFIKLMEEKNE